MAKKYSARRSGELIQNLEEELGRSCDPLEFLLRQMVCEDKPWDFRKECAAQALPYCRPKLATVQVTGKDDGPIQIAAIHAIRDNAFLAQQAEDLALGILEAETLPALPSPADRFSDGIGLTPTGDQIQNP